MPVLVVVLCLLAIAYRYYSAFIAARVAVLDDLRKTPAVRIHDGQNYHPTNKWVLFGHHFAAISGAGPLIGPVLAAQFGFLPGLIWIVVGVCLGGAVQDFLVLVASMRRGGKSLGQIAYDEIGHVAGTAAIAAILFIIVIALAGLGKVVVKALGGESVKFPSNSQLVVQGLPAVDAHGVYSIPGGATLEWNKQASSMVINEQFAMKTVAPATWVAKGDGTYTATIPAGSVRVVPGSSWGTFTIACTIPIAFFVGVYMYRIRKGRVVEASIIGGVLTLVATVAGGYVAAHSYGAYFNLTTTQVMVAMAIYGFIASVLPVWVLLCPRDYLSSFLKIGTIGLLVIGTLIANPKLEAPAFNTAFFGGGPVVTGKIFPFLFITIMCGAISGFHSLVSSGTTPKMIGKEKDARMIGYGAMLIEGLVGVVAMIAASTLPPADYYAMNIDLEKAPGYHDRLVSIGAGVDHLNVYEQRTEESLRGRTGGGVTLAVGMAHIFDQAAGRFASSMQWLWKYWYHFAIMFEALFILTTIDTGTRIGRFLLQEVAGKVNPKLGRADWWPGATVSTLLIVVAWSYFIDAKSFAAIWKMFGVANQMLAVIALSVVSVVLVNEGKLKYIWVTVVPLAVVLTTTGTAAIQLLVTNWNTLSTQLSKAGTRDWTLITGQLIEGGLTATMLICALIVLVSGIVRVCGRPRVSRGFALAVEN